MNVHFAPYKSLFSFEGLLVALLFWNVAASRPAVSQRPDRAIQVSVKLYAQSVDPDSSKVLVKGSGVMISADGLILTNYHNVAGAFHLEAQRPDGQKYVARVVDADPRMDLALVKIEVKGMPFARLGRTESLRVGQQVYSVGSTGSLDFFYAGGMIGGLDRRIGAISDPQRIEQFVQTDLPLNPGCSGGPLFNADGELLGINTAILSVSGRFEGYSFAVPVGLIQKFLDHFFQSNRAGMITPDWVGTYDINNINH